MNVTARVWPVSVDEQPKLTTSFQYTPDITASLYGVMWSLRQALDEHPHAAAPVRERAARALAAGAVITDQRDFTEDVTNYRTWRDQAASALIALS